jgi:hypothetical protein
VNQELKRAAYLCMICLIVIMACTNCSSVKKQAPLEEPKYYTHVVKWHEETILLITSWYTDNLDNFDTVLHANPGINPYQLSNGDRVQIPQTIMTKTAPMPRGYRPKPLIHEANVKKAPVGEQFICTVQWPYESLSIIAKWYTGDLLNWELLAEANPGLDPNRISIGDSVVIPESLLVRRDPVTQSFVQSFLPKTELDTSAEPAEAPPDPPPPEPEEDLKIFGPK